MIALALWNPIKNCFIYNYLFNNYPLKMVDNSLGKILVQFIFSDIKWKNQDIDSK